MTESTTVPFVDLGLQHRRIASEVEQGFARVLGRTSFILGPDCAAFEEEYADYCGIEHCVGLANGTDALEIALAVAGVGAGDEVIVPANTFVATAEAVARVGARIVLADCDEHFLIDPEDAAARVTEHTRAVMAVHLYGQMADVDALRRLLPDGVQVIEDAAQSQGARSRGRRSGSLGDVAATSFYPGKNLGAYGDAGAMTTGSTEHADLARKLRNHGGVAKYEHVAVGRNSRLDDLQAVVLRTKLAVLDEWNQERRDAAAAYEALLAPTTAVVLPRIAEGNEHVFHLYVVRVPERDRVLASLTAAGVGAGIHYPTPVHLLPAFPGLGAAGDFPRAEGAGEEILSLPMFPGITQSQQERVAEALVDAVR